MTKQLDRYLTQREITPDEHAAGLMFFADREVARHYLRIRSTADRTGADRYRRACGALGELRPVVVAVVVNNCGCSTWAFESGRKRVEGMRLLREGLGVLTAFYSMAGGKRVSVA